MHILITGAAGMIGRKLVAALGAQGSVGGRDITRLTLVDIVSPTPPAGVTAVAVAADLSTPDALPPLLEDRPDVIFHLAAVVSGEAEADYDKGERVNLAGSLALLRGIAAMPDYTPRVVFASSVAVFGAPLPDPIPDDHPALPLTSYGTQKAMTELMISDLSRRGALDGISLRLPTICVRPGKPNAAASGFFSGILREPLNGQEAILPVAEEMRHWFASPRAAIGFLLHAAGLDLSRLGPRRALSLPGVVASVGDQIAALHRVAGDRGTDLIRRAPDPTIQSIVETWPRSFDPQRARALGFEADADMDAILRVYVEDELGGRIPVLDG